MNEIILSISIPTYNRKKELVELIHQLTSIDSSELEIVVTDNQSTDGTIDALSMIRDRRLKIYKNEEPVPGYYNMILGLFHSAGKYVLHCNDRDIIFTEKIPSLIRILKDGEYSFIQTTRAYLQPTNTMTVYEKGYDSLINQSYSSHPTGMVFHRQLMKKYLHKEHYLQYVDDIFTYCFLKRELMVYEKSAVLDIGCWNERNSKIKLRLKSGSIYKGGLYFEPDRISGFMKSVIKHFMDNNYFLLTRQQQSNIILSVIQYFKKQLVYKKLCYADARECCHYGIKKQFITYFDMKRIYEMYINDCSEVISYYGFENELEEQWNQMKLVFMKGLLRDCLAADKAIVYKIIKRMTDKNYPY